MRNNFHGWSRKRFLSVSFRIHWQTGGTAVCTATKDQDECQLAPDGQGGVLFAWIDERSDEGCGDIYSQRASDCPTVNAGMNLLLLE